MWALLRVLPHLTLKTNVSFGLDWLCSPTRLLCPVCEACSVEVKRLSLLLYSGHEQYLKPLGGHYTTEGHIMGQETQCRRLLTNGERKIKAGFQIRRLHDKSSVLDTQAQATTSEFFFQHHSRWLGVKMHFAICHCQVKFSLFCVCLMCHCGYVGVIDGGRIWRKKRETQGIFGNSGSEWFINHTTSPAN